MKKIAYKDVKVGQRFSFIEGGLEYTCTMNAGHTINAACYSGAENFTRVTRKGDVEYGSEVIVMSQGE